jgi:hypothetical protein
MDGGTCEATTKFCLFLGDPSECEVTNYESASVGIAPLPQNQSLLVRALRGKSPAGGTPMRAAVEGALAQLRTHLVKNPGRKAVLVLASDGLPSCSPPALHGIPAIADLVGKARLGTPSIVTYVIGVFSPGEISSAAAQLNLVATAGGSSQAFVLTATDDLAMRLQDALNTIRGSALSCEYKIPTDRKELDFGAVKVRFTTNAGTREELRYVHTMASCDSLRGGWYYDIDPATGTPTRIHVCPTSCDAFKKEGSGQVDLAFGCSPR